MTPYPPEPPSLSPDDVTAIIEWLETTAEWLRREQDEASARGHVASPEAVACRRLYDDAAVVFREAYDRDYAS